MDGNWREQLKFSHHGLMPVAVQDAATDELLMLAYADREAVERTTAEGRAWFFSRSRRSPWLKGETSGNFLDVLEIRYDCDADTLLYRARPHGPTCHTGERSCFFRTGWRRAGDVVREACGEDEAAGPVEGRFTERSDEGTGYAAGEGGDVLSELYELILSRKAAPPSGSYVARLLSEGRDRILQKVGEEAVEVVLAGKNDDRERLVSELADLLFHLTVLLGEREVPWNEVFAELRRRRR